MRRGIKRNKKVKVEVRVKKKQNINPAFMRLRKWVLALFCFGLIISCPVCLHAQTGMVWQKSDYGIDEAKIKSVCVVKERPLIVFAASQRCIYKSFNIGKSWARVLMLTGQKRNINFITYNPEDPSIVYAATSDGLYISLDSGKSWTRQFRGTDDSQRNVECVSVTPGGDILLIGTQRGLFKSTDHGKSWTSENHFTNKGIRSIAAGKGFFYVGAEDGVYYQAEGDSNWDKMYNLVTYKEETVNEYEDNDEMEADFINLNSIAIDKGMVYIATDEGVLFSQAGTESWQRMEAGGLKTNQIDFILAEDEAMLVASKRGVFEYDQENNIWLDRSTGLNNLRINTLSGDLGRGPVFAATEKGLFRSYLTRYDSAGTQPISNLYLDEPGIDEIHLAAIEYAEVSPDKIKWMRQAAKAQALIPKFSFKLDGNVNRNLSIDRGGTNDPDFFIEGPKDKKLGWGIGFNWDLSELVWSYHQTSIDVRSRLMVQLRNDILDEVTKLYFERLRLKDELLQNPPADKRQLTLKQLRLAELTANIDAMTGNYLSKNVKNRATTRF